MKAILLCAGFGTRLGSVTENRPKALVDVAGQPILDYLIEQLLAVEALTEVHLVSNARFLTRFYRWKEGTWRAALRERSVAFHLYSDGATNEAERLGAVGDLAHVLQRTETGEGALVAAGDSIYRFPLAPLTRRFRTSEGSLVLALHEADRQRLREQSVLALGEENSGEANRVLGVEHAPDDPASSWTCPACYWLAPSALARVPSYLAQTDDRDTLGHFIHALAQQELVRAAHLPERPDVRFHINTRHQLEKATRTLAEEPFWLSEVR